MTRSTYWVKWLSIPALLASAGCSMGHRPNAQTYGHFPPERMMAMAQAFERQGRNQQAKNAYQQVLAVNPEYPGARESLDTLIASEANQNRSRFDLSKVPVASMMAEKRSEIDKKSSETARNQATRSVNREIAKPTPKQIAQKRDVALSKSKSIESEDSVFDSPKIDTASLPVNDDLTAIQPGVPERPLASLVDSEILLSDEMADHPVLVQEANTQTNPLPEFDVVAGLPVLSDQRLAPTEQQPSPTAHPLNMPVKPFQAVKSEHPKSPSEEQLEFLQPGTHTDRVSDVGLRTLFGPFEAAIVETAKENRARYQPQLIEIACDRHATIEMRSRSIFLLGEIGRDAIETLPALRHQMHAVSDQFLKVDLCEAILKIQPEDEDAIRSLVESLKDSDSEVRWIAAFALRFAVSPRTTHLIEPLREAMKTDDLKLRRMVLLTLSEFGPAASAALPELYATLDCNDRATRDIAMATLDSISPEQAVRPVLE